MDYRIVGKIINSHGINGEVKIYPLTSNINRFSLLEKSYIGDEKLEVNLDSVKYHKGNVIMKFNEFNNINDILKFKNNYIYINEEDKINLPEDSFFIDDLIESNVYDLSGKLIGIIKDIIQGASNDVYVIRDPKLDKDYLIPAIKEFIKEVNIKEKKVIIDPIEGMIE